MNTLDIFVQNYFASVRTSFLTEFLYSVTTFFDISPLTSAVRFLVLILCVALLIYIIRNKKSSFLFAFSVFIGLVFSIIFKYFFDVARPVSGLIVVTGPSFPSFHATISTIFFGMLMFIFDGHMGMVKRIIFNTFCVISILLVCISRLYLGVHWLSDVLGGIVLGVLICFIVIRFFKRLK